MHIRRISKCPGHLFSVNRYTMAFPILLQSTATITYLRLQMGNLPVIDVYLLNSDITIFEVMNVPNCDYIEIHIGNYPQIDSDGCILLGTAQEANMVTNSKIAFASFMENLNGIDTFQLTVE